MPSAVASFPSLRYMGSKRRLLEWIHGVLRELDFESAIDAFSGSGSVAFLMKAMGRRVIANDFLRVGQTIARATIENPGDRLGAREIERLCGGAFATARRRACPGAVGHARAGVIERTFRGIFFTPPELRFLDGVWDRLDVLATPYQRALALASLMRACIKRQPRGVFTVAGDPAAYKDGRRDLCVPLSTLFAESAAAYSACVGIGPRGLALRQDALSGPFPAADLVYLDPPYVPRADDNCYVKRYHFLEGLATRWRASDAAIQWDSKVRKIAKRFTPFSYRRTAIAAFETLLGRFPGSTLVLSYSSNGFPDLTVLAAMMERVRRRVQVHERPHRYHFGTHAAVSPVRANVREYLVVGRP